jgi:hypothetical protein
MTSSESDGAPSRKRSRPSNSTEDGVKDGKKARGRPRVDPQDSTAADVSTSSIRDVAGCLQGCITCLVVLDGFASWSVPHATRFPSMKIRKANDHVAAKDPNTPCTTSLSSKERNNHLFAQPKE